MTLPKLRHFRGEKIDMDCRRCDRHGVYDRKALVKKFGASIAFVEIRRRLAIGCADAGTAQCMARFPCLLEANILIDEPRKARRR
nr:hypothetical protein [uncultured Shinella sp.]